jgi:hypothetical protein
MINVPEGDLDSWLEALKPFQRTTIIKFSETLTAEEVAEKWLTTIGSPNIASFGGTGAQDPKPYWLRFKAECRRFICDEGAYVEEKRGLASEFPISKPLLISVMSSAIGHVMGTAGTLVAPAVTLMLFTVCSVGHKAFCAT